MRTWKRATQAVPCGGPHAGLVTIPVGAPMLTLTSPKLRILYRCEACAGEPAPNLPKLAGLDDEEEPRYPPVQRITLDRLLKVLPFDYKAAQGGREVGEEG